MLVLFIGDVVGKAGCDYVSEVLPHLIADRSPDLVIANCENASQGKGLNRRLLEQLYDAGVELVTLGNHAWDDRDIFNWIDQDERVVRPDNYPPGTPGRGFTVCKVNGSRVLLINLMGRTFLSQLDCPFRAADRILNDHPDITTVIVDMHAETTSEKLAMGWHLDGRASVVVGTHTHVQTADARVLPNKTGYITDVGMVGPRDGILGMARDAVLRKFTTQLPVRFEVAAGLRQFCAAWIDIDDGVGRCRTIQPIYMEETE